MSTGATLLARVRVWLHETTAKRWTDAELYGDINAYVQLLAATVGMNPENGHFKWRESFTILAGIEYKDLLGAGVLTYEPDEIRSVSQLLTNGTYEPLSPMAAGAWEQNRQVNAVSPDFPPRYGERRAVITNARAFRFYAYPVATGTRTFQLDYRYVPGTISGSTESPLSLQYDELIALGAAQTALGRSGQKDAAVDEQLAKREALFLTAESRTIGGDVPQGTKDVVGSQMWD